MIKKLLRLLAATGLVAVALHPAPLAAQRPAVSVITGTLTGADGRPMSAAHAVIRAGRYEQVAVGKADARGRFAVAYPGTGPLGLELSGVGHEPHTVELYLDSSRTVALDVRLARQSRKDSITAVKAIGDFNHFEWKSALPLIRRADSSWTLEIETKADTVAYQLLGVHGMHAVPGTDAARYTLRGRGGYASVVNARDGRATLVFDPRRLQGASAGDTAAIVRFRDRTGRVARAAAVLASMSGRIDRMMAGYRSAVPGDSAQPIDWTVEATALARRVDRERDPIVRRLMLLELMQLAAMKANVPARYGERTLREIPPGSQLWTIPMESQFGLSTSAVMTAEAVPGRFTAFKENPRIADRLAAFTDAAVAAQPSPEARANLLGRAVSPLVSAGRAEKANAYLARLASEHPDASITKSTLAQHGSDRALMVGKQVPAFRFAALGDSASHYTPESLRGKVYLLDFWATWCAPCISEMPVLHEVHERYRDRGFEILSISADASPAVVKSFREGKWRMPWLHTFVEGGLESAEMKKFEILFLPRAALVDRDGKIVAVDREVRGAELEKSLERLLR